MVSKTKLLKCECGCHDFFMEGQGKTIKVKCSRCRKIQLSVSVGYEKKGKPGEMVTLKLTSIPIK